MRLIHADKLAPIRRAKNERRPANWENWVNQTQRSSENGPPCMYSTTGFSRESIADLCAMISAEAMDGKRPWPPVPGLCKSVVVALTYMRRNRVQAELAETYGVSQPTISRAVTGITPLLGKVLRDYVPTASELDGRTQYIVDGTLLPSGNR